MSKRVLFCIGRLVANGKVVMPAIGKKWMVTILFQLSRKTHVIALVKVWDKIQIITNNIKTL